MGAWKKIPQAKGTAGVNVLPWERFLFGSRDEQRADPCRVHWSHVLQDHGPVVFTSLSRKIIICEVSGKLFKRILAHFRGKIRCKPKAFLVLLNKA